MLFLAFRPWGKLAFHGYNIKHIWISAELRRGARRSKRRLAGLSWQGIAFRPPETSRSLAEPQIVYSGVYRFDSLVHKKNNVRCCVVRRKMAR